MKPGERLSNASAVPWNQPTDRRSWEDSEASVEMDLIKILNTIAKQPLDAKPPKTHESFDALQVSYEAGVTC